MPYYATYGIWLKFWKLIQILIYLVSMLKTSTNTNIVGLIKKGKYEYKYFWGDKKGRIQIWIWIFGLIFTNTNIRHKPVLCYVSHVTCLVSHVTCHMSHVTCFFVVVFGKNGENSRRRQCLIELQNDYYVKTKVIALDWQWVTFRIGCQMNPDGHSSPVKH